MKVNNQTQIQQKTPNFGAKMIKPNQLNKAPYASVPLALGALATLGMAQLLLDSKSTEKILTPEEIEKIITNMQKADGTPRFSDFEISNIKYHYEKNNANKPLFIKLINLKSADGEYVFDFYDIIYAHEEYENHPEFSEFVINDVKNLETSIAKDLSRYIRSECSDQKLLLKLYNRREKERTTVFYYEINEIYQALKLNPQLFNALLDEQNNVGSSEKYIHSGFSISVIYEAYKKDPKTTEELLNARGTFNDRLGAHSIRNIVLYEDEEIKKSCIDIIKSIQKTKAPIEIFLYDEIQKIKEKDPKLIEKIFSSLNAKGECPFDIGIIKFLSKTEEDAQNYIINFAIKGINIDVLRKNPKHVNEYKIMKQLLDKGLSPQRLSYLIKYKSLEDIAKDEEFHKTPMREFFEHPDFLVKIKENSAGKYQNELIKLFDPEKMPYQLYSDLVNSNLTVEDFLSSLRKISKSSFKLAYNTPNQYLDGLSTEISTQVNGHYPKLEENELAQERSKVYDFFINNFTNLARLLKYVDPDIVNHLMDKRFEIFGKELEVVKNIPDEKMELMSKLLHCKSEKTGKDLSVKERYQVYEIVKFYSIGNFSDEYLKNIIQKGIVNVDKLKESLSEEIYKQAGADLSICNPEDIKFNKDYLYLILEPSALEHITANQIEEETLRISKMISNIRKDKEELKVQKEEISEFINSPEVIGLLPEKFINCAKEVLEMFSNIEKYSNKEILDKYMELMFMALDIYSAKTKIHALIKAVATGNFNKYINDKNNIYGQANSKTEEIFKEKGLNFAQWLKTDIENLEFELASNNLTIKLWDRNPMEDLFIGNKTTCCTGIGKTNGAATPMYIMSNCWNVVQLLDENGEVVGMSRIFVGENNGECSIMMDNIELNYNFIKNISEKEKVQIRDHFFKYIHQLAEKVIGKDAKVYFYKGDKHVNTDDLQEYCSKFEFVGKNPESLIYVNSADMRWINPENFKNMESEWFIVPKQ